MIESISAITLATHDMARSVRFYTALGFEPIQTSVPGPIPVDASFTSLRAGTSYLNLTLQPSGRNWTWWGRVIFYVSDVDALHATAIQNGLRPDTAPRDAPWAERYFHLTDPDGHELSFAKPIGSSKAAPPAMQRHGRACALVTSSENKPQPTAAKEDGRYPAC